MEALFQAWLVIHVAANGVRCELLLQCAGNSLTKHHESTFEKTGLLLSAYVDDLTLAGPKHLHDGFWKELIQLVDLEPPEPIYRVLGTIS